MAHTLTTEEMVTHLGLDKWLREKAFMNAGSLNQMCGSREMIHDALFGDIVSAETLKAEGLW